VRRSPAEYLGIVVIAIGAFATWPVAAEDSLEERRQRIENLSPAEKLQLERVRKKFLSLTPDEQKRLRELQRDIELDQNHDQLSETLDRYHAWLRGLSPAERESLQDLKPEERIARIQQLRAQQSKSASPVEKPMLSVNDQKAIEKWLEATAWRHKEELLKALPDNKRENFAKMSEDRQRRALVGFAWGVAWVPAEADVQVTATEKQELAQSLSADARKLWEDAAKDGRRDLTRRWIRMALQNYVARYPIAGTYAIPHFRALQQFMRSPEIDPAERERLLTLPNEERNQELRERWEKRFGVNIEPRKANKPHPTETKSEVTTPASNADAK
jgi:hypothetical protein